MIDPRARVAVTGTGVVSALGSGCSALVRALRDTRVNIHPLTLFDTADQKTHLAAQVPDFNPVDHAPASLRNSVTRTDALALVAAREALAHAKIDPTRLGARVGLVVGGTVGGMLETEGFFAAAAAGHPESVRRPQLVSHPLSAPTDFLALALGVRGPRRTVCSACSSGANALATAMALLRMDACDVVLAGGADALCRLTFSGFNALSAVDARACRPFHRTRAGLTLGEGAGFLVLERLDDVRARGGTPVTEIRAVGVVSEAHHITNPLGTGEGAAQAMEMALAHAGLSAGEVDYINAHGTATPLNDSMECAAIVRVMGARAGSVRVSSTKSMMGHTLGAAGAIESVVCVLAMQERFTPATAGLDDVDPRCADVRHVYAPEALETRDVTVCLSNSFGFGGTDAVVCLCTTEKGDALDGPTRRAFTPLRGNVVITGYGVLGPHSSGDAALDQAEGRAGRETARAGDGVLSAGMEKPGSTLDVARVRRLDRLALCVTDVAAQALTAARISGELASRTGAVIGTAWGSLDGSAAFIRRVTERGARLAPPADFPNLVLSAGVGHLSIYHGLRGPTLTTASLALSGEHALALATEELVAGRAEAMLAGAVDERHPVMLALIDQIDALWPGRDLASHPRSEAAACVVLESHASAMTRDATVLARVASYVSRHCVDDSAPEDLRAGESASDALCAAMIECARAVPSVDVVIVAERTPAMEHALAHERLRGARVLALADQVGSTEALGVMGIALAAKLVAEQRAAHGVLVLGHAPGQVNAIALAPA